MPRALVVDDSRVDRELIAGLLEEESGLEVVGVASAEEALGWLERESPELVVTDLAMPGMGGLELVEKIVAKKPGLPVVLVTSLGSEEAAAEALRRGAASYVPKANLASQLAGIADRLVANVVERRARRLVYTTIQRCETVFELENDRETFPPLIAFVTELVGGSGICDEADLMRLAVALEEALVNAAEHGNLEMGSELREDDRLGYVREVRRRRGVAPWADRRVRFELALSRQEVRLRVRDQGSGFDPHNLPDPADPKNILKASGRGVLLMRTFMDEVIYNETGNEVTMVKRHPPPDDEEDEKDGQGGTDTA
ncbi:MAG TPA: response regulator [Thermoanaerobaculia bacterium]|nr:response regulator [Thermoanaerobaculia bacterium]